MLMFETRHLHVDCWGFAKLWRNPTLMERTGVLAWLNWCLHTDTHLEKRQWPATLSESSPPCNNTWVVCCFVQTVCPLLNLKCLDYVSSVFLPLLINTDNAYKNVWAMQNAMASNRIWNPSTNETIHPEIFNYLNVIKLFSSQME